MSEVTKPVRWGIAGTGDISSTTVTQSAGLENVDFVAVSSRTMARGEAFARAHDIPKVHLDLDALVADPEIDAVYVALPHAMHTDAVLACLDAGKHVLCEKPLAFNSEDAERIASHPRARDVVVAEGFMLRMQPQWKFITETIARGKIGAVEAVHSFTCVQLPDAPKDSSRGDLPFDRSALLDFGSYSVHMARTVFAVEPLRATARAWKSGARDTAVSVRLDFESGHADLTATTRLRGARRFDVLGTSGSLSVARPIHVPPGQRAIIHAVLLGGEDTGETFEFESIPQYGLQMAAVSEAIQKGESPPVGLDNALGNARTLDAIIRSVEADGAWMEVEQ